MALDQARINDLISNPTENLAVEIKNWLNLDEISDQANLLRSILALRNHNGGYIVIGFDNKTLLPDPNRPGDIRAAYHSDKVQLLVSNHASQLFEAVVEIGIREGLEFPVIVVQGGLKTPVAAKRELGVGKRGVQINDIYVRTLSTNHTPSTARVTYSDLDHLMQRCFDNREADIGQFLRRHLIGISPKVIQDFASSLSEEFQPEPSAESRALSLLEESEAKYVAAVAQRGLQLPQFGVWEVALIIDGNAPKIKGSAFLEIVRTHNPSYTGWPIWFDPRNMDKDHPPQIVDGVWEALINGLGDQGFGDHLDYLRLDPSGRFFLLRPLEDDIARQGTGAVALKTFDVMLPIYRTAEAIAVGIALANGMGYQPQETKLSFAFKWTALSGRSLVSWADSKRWFSGYRKAHQAEVSSFIQVPLDTPLSAIGSRVSEVLSNLYDVFGGFEQPEPFVSNVVAEFLSRRR